MMHALRAPALSGAATVLLLAAALSLGQARGGEFAESAAQFVSRLGAEAIGPGAATNPDGATRRLGILLEKFDFAGFGRLTLGPYWMSASPGQRQEFATVLTARFARSYAGYLEEYAGGRLDIIGSRDLPGGDALVGSRIVDAGGRHPMRIDWFIRAGDGATPRIGDVIVGGVSMARTDADEFGSAMRASGLGLDGLLHQLQAKYPDATLVGAAN